MTRQVCKYFFMCHSLHKRIAYFTEFSAETIIFPMIAAVGIGCLFQVSRLRAVASSNRFFMFRSLPSSAYKRLCQSSIWPLLLHHLFSFGQFCLSNRHAHTFIHTKSSLGGTLGISVGETVFSTVGSFVVQSDLVC
jgi:hypothetical protein